MDGFQEAITGIQSIKSVDDVVELENLQAALDRLFQSPSQTEQIMKTLFGLYERFPKSDGYGAFWTVLHGLEKLPGYEPHLKASVKRQPMEFTLRMIGRILNSDLPNNQRQEWLTLLNEVVSNPLSDDEAKADAKHIIEHQSKRT